MRHSRQHVRLHGWAGNLLVESSHGLRLQLTADDSDLQQREAHGTFRIPLSYRQLAAAAEILAMSGPENGRFDAFQLLAFFRTYDTPALGSKLVVTSDDRLFSLTAQAALDMAGRDAFAASHALLEQARSLLSAT
jgi:hypothetical protein